MNVLFAPWRMEFIEGHDKKPDAACVLCTISKASDPESLLIIHRGEHSYVVMNKYPYTNGHLMIVPHRHENDWTLLDENESREITKFTQDGIRALRSALNPQGFNLGVNLGKASGAGIEAHVHQHIVPRWIGDYNFMPVFGEVKVISEHLEATYQKILKSWKTIS